jgi:MFS family permease
MSLLPYPQRPVSKRELYTVFAGLMLALTLASLDQNIVSTALPRIVSDLGGLAHLSWVVTAFMVTSTISTPLYGKLSDMYGRKPLFFTAIIIFLIGSVVCGLAQTMFQLILFRAIQGLGAGGLITLAQTTVGDLIVPRERGKYQPSSLLAASLGPSLADSSRMRSHGAGSFTSICRWAQRLCSSLRLDCGPIATW